MVGVPYSDDQIAKAKLDLVAQADPEGDLSELQKRYPGAIAVGAGGGRVTEMDALVAYLQMLGTQVKFRDIDPGALRQ
jgi:cytochrome c oxidase cbb3-type subunit 2